MKSTRIRTVTFIAAVALLVFAAFGVALACESHGGDGDGSQLAKTHLRLAADVHKVVPGGIVTLTGKLTAQPAETVDADDTGGGDGGTDVASSVRAHSAGLACVAGGGQHGHAGGDHAHGNEATPTPVAGVEVAIFQRIDWKTWSQVGTATTDADGVFSATETVDSDTAFKAVFAGDDTYRAARSRIVKVRVEAEVGTPTVSDSNVRANKHFRVRGMATRGAGKVTVTVFKRSGGKWTAQVASVRATLAGGVYSAQLKLRAGTYRISAVQAGNARVHAASSGYRTLKVAARH